MAATVSWSETNGAGASVSDGITNLNYGNNDNPNLAASAANAVNAGGFSYEKYNKIKFADTFTEISNMKLWKSAGAYGTGEAIKAAANVAYATPVNTESAVATVDIPTTEGTALAINSAAGTATIVAAGYTDDFCTQLHTTASTPSGAVAQKTFTFQYDEV